MRRAVATGLLALLIVTAGCVGGLGSGPATDSPAGDGSTGSADGESGTVNFYVSDRPNDMDDFEHLNVTVTAVRFHLVDPAGNGTDSANGTDSTEETANGTAMANATATATPNGTVTATANGTATATATPTPAADGTENRSEDEPVDEDDRDVESEDERAGESEDGRWVVREVNATTVDLTRLRGANATLVERFDLPAGEYNQVVLEVSETDGTLTDGSSTEVKLPSERLKLDQKFVVGNGQEVDFVYDVTVHRAGNSGKYILRPVASESGTEVPIERVDDDDDEDDRLRVQFAGSVRPGENATVRVTERGDAVANATVSVDGAADGTTNADGEYTFTVSTDAEEVEIEVTAGEREGELEREFEASEGQDGND